MTRIGILGSGFMAQVHAIRYDDINGANVVGVCSPSYPEAFAAEFAPDAAVHDDPEDLFDEELDAVDICTPTATHRPLVEAAAERGLDVLCEKPVERTMEDAVAIEEAVSDAGITFLPGHVLRFFPEYVAAKEQVDAGAIGTPGTVSALRQSPVAATHPWFHDFDASGGVLLDLAIHDFDFLRWTIGAVESVFTRRRTWDENEYTTTMLRFEDGTIGTVDARWPTTDEVPFVTELEIAGDDGLIEFDSETVDPLRVHAETNEPPASDPVDVPLTKDPYRLELEHFLACVRGEETPCVSVEDGIEAMCISLSAIESAERGIPVSVNRN
ncbi:Gfo/Idh/MocA family protein [Haladaptatus sp. CMAA 1911]|uniref:Gfo/Idh/MocA family protein n=1 Tax=unclassified Haladaptatus TaxID=2622732 RepID=UPI0037551B64